MSSNNSAGETMVAEVEQADSTDSRVNEVAGFLTASLDSMTPAIMQRMTATMAQMAELVDLVEVINTDEMKNLVATAAAAADSLSRSLEAVKALEESGALKALVEVGDFAFAMKQSMTSGILTGSLSTVLSLAETGDQMLEAVRESVNEAKKDTRKVGPMTLWNVLKDSQTQESLKFLLAMARRLPGLLETL